jgi:hypothetical protein
VIPGVQAAAPLVDPQVAPIEPPEGAQSEPLQQTLDEPPWAVHVSPGAHAPVESQRHPRDPTMHVEVTVPPELVPPELFPPEPLPELDDPPELAPKTVPPASPDPLEPPPSAEPPTPESVPPHAPATSISESQAPRAPVRAHMVGSVMRFPYPAVARETALGK